jgi:hypothetical protein
MNNSINEISFFEKRTVHLKDRLEISSKSTQHTAESHLHAISTVTDDSVHIMFIQPVPPPPPPPSISI